MNKGFSLVEILIVVAIAAAVVIVVSNFGNNVAGLNILVTSELQAKSDVNQSLQIMTEEIQSAETSGNGAYPIDTVGTTTFSFYSDIYKNGSAEHVRYFYSSSTIYKGVIVPTGTPVLYPTSSEVVTDFIDNVIISSATPLFSYYDSSYTGSQAPLQYPISIASIRLAAISFEVQSNQTSTIKRSPLEYFSSLVDLRNLDSN